MEIRSQLNTAAVYVQNNQPVEALTIYNFLLPLNVPEAQYGAANLGLQGKNPGLTCEEALVLMRKASDAGYLPAKRTLGYLFMFAENDAVLSINGYAACNYEKNFSRARQYLTQAANGGDSTARSLLNELNLQEQGGGD